MAEKRILIEHPDGRAYSVTPAAYRELYEPEGFTVTGPETRAAFEPDVPKPSRKRAKPSEPAEG